MYVNSAHTAANGDLMVGVARGRQKDKNPKKDKMTKKAILLKFNLFCGKLGFDGGNVKCLYQILHHDFYRNPNKNEK